MCTLYDRPPTNQWMLGTFSDCWLETSRGFFFLFLSSYTCCSFTVSYFSIFFFLFENIVLNNLSLGWILEPLLINRHWHFKWLVLAHINFTHLTYWLSHKSHLFQSQWIRNEWIRNANVPFKYVLNFRRHIRFAYSNV